MAIALDSKFPGPLRMMAAEQARSEAEGDVLPWTVAEFYRGQSVLLTGGSGFVGRVLLEKLLFYCPDIDTVYVLLRPRKGLSVQERLHKLLDVPLYPAAGDWRSILALVEAQGQNDPVALRALTTKILGPYCNTYTFTKNLAEHIVDHYSDRLPVGILRPSVVVATACDPLPGWIDNFNGPMGLMVGIVKGVVHTSYTDPDCYIDYIPCDIVVKGIVLCSCEVARKGLGPPLVYHAAQGDVHRITQARALDYEYEAGAELPFSDTLYHPCGRMTSNYLRFLVQFFFFHLKRLRPEDREGFCYQFEKIVPEAYFRHAQYGTRRYLMKEPDSNLPQAVRAYK
ncbi:Fatty acyl-CoA reductase, partial [Gryllus bimaculatus]